MDLVVRTARALEMHGLSLAEHFVLCSAGYRVTHPPDAFVAHAFAASAGDRRGQPSLSELAAALDRLLDRGLLTCLTDADLRAEARRRARAVLPEVHDVGYAAGHVDFTRRGHALHRRVIRAIHGDDHLARHDAGFNLDADAGRCDVYAVRREDCLDLMRRIEAGGDDYTGVERTRFVEREGPSVIARWRPSRFVVRAAGYHGVLRFRSEPAAPHGADGPAPFGR